LETRTSSAITFFFFSAYEGNDRPRFFCAQKSQCLKFLAFSFAVSFIN
jgi:hypothetical protein